MKKVVLVSETQDFQNKIGALAVNAGLAPLKAKSISDLLPALERADEFSVVVFDGQHSADGCFSDVQSIFEAGATAAGLKQDFNYPSHIFVVSDADQVWSAVLDDSVRVFRTGEYDALQECLLDKVAA